MDWTDDVIVRLRGLWAEGHTTAEIGRRLGVSKNAVVGKAHRLDLPARPSPIRRDGGQDGGVRRSAPRRVAGPTLPPLSSADIAASSPAIVRDAVNNPASAGAPSAGSMRGGSAAGGPVSGRPASAGPDVANVPAATAPAPAWTDRAASVTGRGQVDAAASRAGADRSRAAPPIVAPTRVHVVSRPFARTVTCCWPIGEPGTKAFRFCDSGATSGKPYCAEHAALAYVKVRDRREDAA